MVGMPQNGIHEKNVELKICSCSHLFLCIVHVFMRYWCEIQKSEGNMYQLDAI
eukprot:TRINITY_DN2746_c0_g1_i1.p1 TRINITY_DN2746_c0_g1~~TRINITY_DN2746_c0_g1_i1.p1  ORF type:complete len:53 (+),score=7.07 TRINITY_DN2746_c0_g1_i1:166-324(+)